MLTKSFETLGSNLFDYAGLFPPASLNLDTALNNYKIYQKHKYTSLLGKFIFPISQFEKISAYYQSSVGQHQTMAPIPFSILLSTSKQVSEISSQIKSDKIKILNFIDNFDNYDIDSFEIALPSELFEKGMEKSTLNYIDELNNHLLEATDNFELFIELPILENQVSLQFLKLFSEFRKKHHHVCAKIRTGGTTPEKVPNSSVLCEVFLNLAKEKIPLKVTAGLHQPFPNFNRDVGTTMHGFMNVLFSNLIAHFDENKDQILNMKNVLDEKNLQSFTHNEFGISWKSFEFKRDVLQNFRDNYFKGIGTCEFIEPIEGLIKHQYL